jgi:hypothetical protein
MAIPGCLAKGNADWCLTNINAEFNWQIQKAPAPIRERSLQCASHKLLGRICQSAPGKI